MIIQIKNPFKKRKVDQAASLTNSFQANGQINRILDSANQSIEKMIVIKVFKRNSFVIIQQGRNRFEAANGGFSLGEILKIGDEVEIIQQRSGIPDVRKVAPIFNFQKGLGSNHLPQQASS